MLPRVSVCVSRLLAAHDDRDRWTSVPFGLRGESAKMKDWTVAENVVSVGGVYMLTLQVR